MFDFMRDRGTGDRYQETMDAYLDNTLTAAERARFEAQMAADPRLRAEVEQLRVLRLQLRAMPRRRVPRSFALNPATYSRPKAQPLLQLYPVLRGATAVSAFLFIFVLALGLFNSQFGGATASQAVQVTRAVTESVAEVVEEAAMEDAAPAAVEEAAPMIVATETVREAPASEDAADAAAVVTEAVVTEAPAEAIAVSPEEAPAEGAAVPVPEGELTLESAELVPEATLPPNAGGAIESAAPEPTAPAAATIEAFAQNAAADEEALAYEAEPAPRSLLPWQIGLGVLFLVLLVLLLLARRRVRSF
jgi:hypothetical protein